MGIGQRTDVDIFGIRFPYRQELLYNPMEDELIFTRFQKPYVIIAEVKTDRCSLNGPWTNPQLGNMQRVLRSIGAFCPDNTDAIADHLYRNGFFEDENYIVSLFCVGRRENPEYLRRYPSVPQITWENIAGFIYRRFNGYYEQKSINRQWDSSGKLIWNMFQECKKHDNGEEDYISTIIGSLHNSS
jgi:hypothetical protein